MSEYNYELATSYPHAKKCLLDFIENPRNKFYSYKLIIVGKGSNGKSSLVREIDSTLRKNNYRIFHDIDSSSEIVRDILEKPI